MGKMYKNERCIIIDESGNLGSQGNYFVIACIDTYNYKSIHNLMKNKVLKAFRVFPELAIRFTELKAKDSYPAIKDHILSSLIKKNIGISYIIIDKTKINAELISKKNELYNYMTKLLLDKVLTNVVDKNRINILLDSHSTRVESKNSLKEYIDIHFNFELRKNINLNIQYINSDSEQGYVIQAIDFIANAIYSNYEFQTTPFYQIIKNRIINKIEFPYKSFGK